MVAIMLSFDNSVPNCAASFLLSCSCTGHANVVCFPSSPSSPHSRQLLLGPCPLVDRYTPKYPWPLSWDRIFFLAFSSSLLLSDYLPVGIGLFLKTVIRLHRAWGMSLWDVVVGAEFIRSFRIMTFLFSPMLSFLALPIESSGGLFVFLFFEVFPSALSGSFTVFFNSLSKADLASSFFSLLLSIRLRYDMTATWSFFTLVETIHLVLRLPG